MAPDDLDFLDEAENPAPEPKAKRGKAKAAPAPEPEPEGPKLVKVKIVGNRLPRAETHALPDGNRAVLHHRLLADRDLGKIGPDRPVEDVVLDRLERCRGGMHGHRRSAPLGDRVDHQRQRGKVIEVRMGDEDVIDRRQLVEREIGNAGPGVDQLSLHRMRRAAPASSHLSAVASVTSTISPS